ncbi:glycoside hydrolase family 88/105 protein [Maribellus mangrovi]|uniref:glycoside hydrolase family 88/105 protein n=1 Tax=Maribellus mangrovi TaxID=3133146 RepID=UPI0030EF2B5F
MKILASKEFIKRKDVMIIKIIIISMVFGTFSFITTAQSSFAQTKISEEERIKADLDRIFDYLDKNTPARIVDRESNEVITDYKNIDASSVLERGDFGITSYEWGVTYSGMLKVAEITEDKKYADYTFERLKLLGEAYPYFKKVNDETGRSGLRGLVAPIWLDDCGSMGAAMMKASLVNPVLAETIRPVIDNAFDFVMYKEFRLYNGILARLRPTKNSVWLDDMYMGIPPIAYMAKLLENEDPEKARLLYDEAALQIEFFKMILWRPEKNLYRHGWIEIMEEHPSFYWARANGWALLAISDVLDVLPEDHIARGEIMELFKNHIRGLAALQSGEGSWHQLLDRNDSYLETSASAMYTYCIAHAINKDWIDGMVYGPIALAGWNAVAAQINEIGQVENTCVGTGLGFNPGFYYKRPVSVFAAHGYGPVLLASAEVLQLLDSQKR